MLRNEFILLPEQIGTRLIIPEMYCCTYRADNGRLRQRARAVVLAHRDYGCNRGMKLQARYLRNVSILLAGLLLAVWD